jgi:glycerol-3-phosphate O-acyltransferase
VTFYADGREPVWLIEPERQLAATFYRNSLIHFLLDTALCELAVLGAWAGPVGVGGADGVYGADLAGADPVWAFWAEIARLRDLLKFEFYFQDRDEHRRQVQAEMDRHAPGWEETLRAGPAQADALLAGMRPLVSQVVVRPFVEAYRIVADVLADDETLATGAGGEGAVGAAVRDGAAVREEVIGRALGLGRQYVAQRRLRSAEAVSALLFQTALQLADNKGLLEAGPDLLVRRTAFLVELRDLLRRLDQVEDLAIRRYIRDAVQARPAD